jgi:tetratricopeptide (TPR) repeat protein
VAWLAGGVLPASAARGEEPAVGPPSAAAPVPPEARRLTERGLERFAAGRYDEAVSDFEASYALAPVPGLLYDLAQAHRLRGDCAAALSFYRRFLEADPGGKLRERTRARIAEMEKCAAAKPPVPAPAPAPATPEAAAPPATPTATPPPPPAPPAPAPPPAARPAAPAATLVTAAPPPVLHAVAPPASGPSWRRRAGLGLGVAALALGATSAWLGVEVARAADDTSRVAHEAGTWDAANMDREQSALRDQKLAYAAGTAAVIAAAAAVWLLLHPERKPAP